MYDALELALLSEYLPYRNVPPHMHTNWSTSSVCLYVSWRLPLTRYQSHQWLQSVRATISPMGSSSQPFQLQSRGIQTSPSTPQGGGHQDKQSISLTDPRQTDEMGDNYGNVLKDTLCHYDIVHRLQSKPWTGTLSQPGVRESGTNDLVLFCFYNIFGFVSLHNLCIVKPRTIV